MKSRSGCGRRQAADNAIRFCYSIGRERYLFELLSLTSSIIMINVCRQEAHKIGKRNKQINHLLFFLQRAEAIRIVNEGGIYEKIAGRAIF